MQSGPRNPSCCECIRPILELNDKAITTACADLESLSWRDLVLVLLTVPSGRGGNGSGFNPESAFTSLIIDVAAERSRLTRALRLATAILLNQAGIRLKESYTVRKPTIDIGKCSKSNAILGFGWSRHIIEMHNLCLPDPGELVMQLCKVLSHGEKRVSMVSTPTETTYKGASLAYAPALLDLARMWCDAGSAASWRGNASHSSRYRDVGSKDCSQAKKEVFALPEIGMQRLRRSSTVSPSVNNTHVQSENMQCILQLPTSFFAKLGGNLFLLLFGAYPSSRPLIVRDLFSHIANTMQQMTFLEQQRQNHLKGSYNYGQTIECKKPSGKSRQRNVSRKKRVSINGVGTCISQLSLLSKMSGLPGSYSKTMTSFGAIGTQNIDGCWQYIAVLQRMTNDRRLCSILHRQYSTLINEWLEQLLAMSAPASTHKWNKHDAFITQGENWEKTNTMLLAMTYALRPLFAVDSVACGCVFSVARKLSGGWSMDLRLRAVWVVGTLLLDCCLLPPRLRTEASSIIVQTLRSAPSFALAGQLINFLAKIMKSNTVPTLATSIINVNIMQRKSHIGHKRRRSRNVATSSVSDSHSNRNITLSTISPNISKLMSAIGGSRQASYSRSSISSIFLKELFARLETCLGDSTSQMNSVATRTTSRHRRTKIPKGKRAQSTCPQFCVRKCFERVVTPSSSGPASISVSSIPLKIHGCQDNACAKAYSGSKSALFLKAVSGCIRVREDPAVLMQAIVYAVLDMKNDEPQQIESSVAHMATKPRSSTTNFQNTSIMRLLSKLTPILCYTIETLADPNRMVQLLLQLDCAGSANSNYDDANDSESSDSEIEWNLDNNSSVISPRLSSGGLSQNQGLVAAASNTLRLEEMAEEAEMKAQLQPTLHPTEVSLPLIWRIFIPLHLPLIELLVHRVILNPLTDAVALTSRLHCSHIHDVALRLHEHYAWLYRMLPAQAHWKQIDSWTASATLAATNAVQNDSGSSSSGTMHPPGVLQFINAGHCGQLSSVTALAILERFTYLYNKQSVKPLISKKRPSLLCTIAAVDSLLCCVKDWDRNHMFERIRIPFQKGYSRVPKLPSTLVSDQFLGTSAPTTNANITLGEAILTVTLEAVCNMFQTTYLHGPGTDKVAEQDDLSWNGVVAQPCLISAVGPSVNTVSTDFGPYETLRQSRWWRKASRLTATHVWFELVEKLFLLCNRAFQVPSLHGKSTDYVRKYLCKNIASIRIHSFDKSKSLYQSCNDNRKGMVSRSESLLDHLKREFGVCPNSSAHKDGIDFLAVYIVHQATKEIKEVGLTSCTITRTLQLLNTLRHYFRGFVDISNLDSVNMIVTIVPTRHLVAAAIYGVLCDTKVNQSKVLNQLLKFALAWAAPEFALRVTIGLLLTTYSGNIIDNSEDKRDVPFDFQKKYVHFSGNNIENQELNELQEQQEMMSLRNLAAKYDMDLREASVSMWSFPSTSNYSCSNINLLMHDTFNLGERQLLYPDSCVESVLITLLNRLEDIFLSNRLELTNKHLQNCYNKTNDRMKHGHLMQMTSTFVIPREQARFKLLYLYMLLLVSILHLSRSSDTTYNNNNNNNNKSNSMNQTHNHAPGSLDQCQKEIAFRTALHSQRLIDHMAKVAHRLLRQFTNAMRRVIKLLRHAELKTTQSEQILSTSCDVSSTVQTIDSYLNIFHFARCFKGSTLLNNRQHYKTHKYAAWNLVCQTSVPLPFAKMMRRIVSQVRLWRTSVDSSLSKTWHSKLSQAVDKFDIQLQKLVEAEIQILNDKQKNAQKVRCEHDDESAHEVMASLWTTLYSEINSCALDPKNARPAVVVPKTRQRRMPNAPISQHLKRARHKRRLRSRNKWIDDNLQYELGDDTFADLEAFVVVDPKEDIHADMDDSQDEAEMNSVTINESTEDTGCLKTDNPQSIDKNGSNGEQSKITRRITPVQVPADDTDEDFPAAFAKTNSHYL